MNFRHYCLFKLYLVDRKTYLSKISPRKLYIRLDFRIFSRVNSSKNFFIRFGGSNPPAGPSISSTSRKYIFGGSQVSPTLNNKQAPSHCRSQVANEEEIYARDEERGVASDAVSRARGRGHARKRCTMPRAAHRSSVRAV